MTVSLTPKGVGAIMNVIYYVWLDNVESITGEVNSVKIVNAQHAKFLKNRKNIQLKRQPHQYGSISNAENSKIRTDT
jgi:hypothetical protein